MGFRLSYKSELSVKQSEIVNLRPIYDKMDTLGKRI